MVLAWVFTLLPAVHASIVMPGDGPYYRHDDGQTVFIYDESTREFIQQLSAYNRAIRALYDQSYGWRLDEQQDLVLTSPRQQIPNAYATVIPSLKTVWFAGGGGLIEDLSQSSWMLGLATHETAHLYQLNAKGPTNSFLKSIFGNSLFISPFVWPVFIHPNVFAPTFMIEGNAVMNESRVNLGGRLHNGEKRALVLAQIKAGDIDPNRLINDGFEFPFGEESYLQGGYFQAHLAAKYGIEKTNSFFLAQGHHYLWPLILNQTFRGHFGESYPLEIREYVRGLEGLAHQQRATETPALIETLFAGPLNHDADRVFFLTTRGRQTPLLQVFDKQSRDLTTTQLDLLPGKVFWNGDEPVTAASFQHDLRHVEYSLYGEHGRLVDGYRGQFVTDQRAGKTVALDGGNAWLDPRLLLNGENYDIAHSTAILDMAGNVYYFRQNGAERILYKNREPQTKFAGFFAKPMEVGADGTFYFIGNTDSGSSLYSWKGKEIRRVLSSDRVVEARSIGGGEFLIIEVGSRGHSVHVVKEESRGGDPAVYSYGFAPQNLTPQPVTPLNERRYNSWRELHYSGFDMYAYWNTGDGLTWTGLASFVDTLEYHGLSLGFQTSEFGTRQGLVQYDFLKWLPDFYLRYSYEDEVHESFDYRWRQREDTITLGMNLPLLRSGRWDAFFGLGLNYEREPEWDAETYGSLANLTLRYGIDPSLSFHPWREFLLSVSNRLESFRDTFEKRENTSLASTRLTHGFPMEFFATLTGHYAWSEGHFIEVSSSEDPLSQDIRIPRLTSHNPIFFAKNAAAVRLEVTKVFNIPLYLPRLPVGFNRIAPVVVGQGLFVDDDIRDRYQANTFEWGYGADIEFLLGHRVPARVRLLNAYDTRYPDQREDRVEIKFVREF
ncbi:MAG TPA: hypothetical protein PKC28_03870 [Bdellovibrionales bacterium]|nr:hypothetical protein [Bdellovibrionales bacterium]